MCNIKTGYPSNLRGCDRWRLHSPARIQNGQTLLVELVRESKFASQIRLLSRPGHLETQKKTCTSASHFDERWWRHTYYRTINQLRISYRDCYSMRKQPSINRGNLLNRAPLVSTQERAAPQEYQETSDQPDDARMHTHHSICTHTTPVSIHTTPYAHTQPPYAYPPLHMHIHNPYAYTALRTYAHIHTHRHTTHMHTHHSICTHKPAYAFTCIHQYTCIIILFHTPMTTSVYPKPTQCVINSVKLCHLSFNV